MTDDHDDRDALAVAFADYRPAPRDIVPRTITDDLTDLATLAGALLEVAYYDFTPTGVAKHTERITVCKPMTREDNQ
jgi:hypothetical protein